MPICRRHFLGLTGLGFGAAIGPGPLRAATVSPALRSPLRLGLVTYNMAKDWDIPTIIRHCSEARFAGVELRTTHAHGVEVSLSPTERAEVRRQFEDSPVELMGLGSAFDYHTPDRNRLRQDIEATKAYIVLARDVGASGVKVRPNAFPPEVSRERTLDQIGRSLGELGRFAADHGQQIRLEVHGRETALLPNIQLMIAIANHPNVGVCWNSNDTDLAGAGFDHNFDLVRDKIIAVHMRDLTLENYPWRHLLNRLSGINYTGYCLAEIPGSSDPVRVMKYYRALFLAYQNLL
jgi:sugar phosphate isomerase/epimerase